MKLVIATIITTMLAAGASARPGCLPHADAAKTLTQNHGEARIAAGLSSDGTLLEIWADPESGTWTILRVLPSGLACRAASGMLFILHEPEPEGDPA